MTSAEFECENFATRHYAKQQHAKGANQPRKLHIRPRFRPSAVQRTPRLRAGPQLLPRSRSRFPHPCSRLPLSAPPASIRSRLRLASGPGPRFPHPRSRFRLPALPPSAPPLAPSPPTPPAPPARAAKASPLALRPLRRAVLQQGVLHISHREDGPARGRPWFPLPGGVKRKWAYCATGYPVFHVCENTTRYVFMRRAGRGLSPCRMFEGRVV